MNIAEHQHQLKFLVIWEYGRFRNQMRGGTPEFFLKLAAKTKTFFIETLMERSPDSFGYVWLRFQENFTIN